MKKQLLYRLLFGVALGIVVATAYAWLTRDKAPKITSVTDTLDQSWVEWHDGFSDTRAKAGDVVGTGTAVFENNMLTAQPDGRSPLQAVEAGPLTFKDKAPDPSPIRTTAHIWRHNRVSGGDWCYVAVEWPLNDKQRRFVTVPEDWCEGMR